MRHNLEHQGEQALVVAIALSMATLVVCLSLLLVLR